MLVLSRRLNEKILFPGFDTAVKVVQVRPGMVRLGIEAPADVTVLRAELEDRSGQRSSNKRLRSETTPANLRERDHEVRNRLNGVNLGLTLLERQLQAGHSEEAQATLARINAEFHRLRQAVEAERPAPPVSPAARKRALLVEDNANECELLAMFLRMAGVEVDTAGDGADALDYLRNHQAPDVLLLDMGLPHCDGPTTVRAIRRDPAYAGLKIFAVTGHPENEFDLIRGPAGVNRWFQKPLDPVALLRDLNQASVEA